MNPFLLVIQFTDLLIGKDSSSLAMTKERNIYETK